MREYRRRLLFDGHPTSIVIHGEKIAAQFACGQHFLLITHYDYFDNASHWFSLLNDRLQVVDQASTPDYFGFIQNITIHSPTEIRFGFFGTNDQWSLSVNEVGRWAFGWPAVARRPNRFILAKRRLALHCVKGKPWTFPDA